jgi:hypothetical protein
MLEREIDGKPSRRFPTRPELLARLIDRGLVADEQDLLERRPDLAATVMLDWIQSTQPGCLFATHLARHRSKAGWMPVVMPRRLSDEQFNQNLDQILAPPPTAEMVMIVFPWVETPEELVDVIAQICACSDWSLVDPISLDGEGPDEVLVGLRWALPSGEAESWVLGFAPFDFMPFTRRGPYAAIVMRPLDPPDWQKRPEPDLIPVHLAQVPHFFGERGAYQGEIWRETERTRSELLGGELTHAAKARVSFVFPRRLADRLLSKVPSGV